MSSSTSSNHSSIQSPTLNLNVIQPDEIQLLEHSLGAGTFGYVKLAKWRNQDVAVKFLNSSDEFLKEEKQLAKVKHENIVTIHGKTNLQKQYVLVMEFADTGCLSNVLHSPEYVSVNYSMSHAISWCLQCAYGVQYLHSIKPKPVIHRDLKPLNLLLFDKGKILKICDFGTARDKQTSMTNNMGSAAWMAPEVFTSRRYSEKCDVFSWGIILWEVLARKQPFKKYDMRVAISWAISQKKRPQMLKKCPSKLRDLMKKCWDHDPANRPSMNENVKTIEAIFNHCKNKIHPLDLPAESLIENNRCRFMISNITNTDSGAISDLDLDGTFLKRRISEDNPSLRAPQTKAILGHKRSSSSDASLLLAENYDYSEDSVINKSKSAMNINQSPNEDQMIAELLQNFNAYLILEGRSKPVQPDVTNFESMEIFEHYRKSSIEIYRQLLHIQFLESYEKRLEKLKNNSTKEMINSEMVSIYRNLFEDNINWKKVRTGLADEYKALRLKIRTRTDSVTRQTTDEGWIMVENDSND